jgi:glutathione synthase/RimK-type ligase-like ATP-grasp enzyme
MEKDKTGPGDGGIFAGRISLAIVSALAYAGTVDEDLWLAGAVTGLGHRAGIESWDDKTVDWKRYDCAVIRSVWGYHQEIEAFEAWLDRMERLGLCLVNSPSIIRDNIHKDRQFSFLGGHNIPMIPSVLVSTDPGVQGAVPPEKTLRDTLSIHFPGMEGPFVLKPLISASGKDTYIIDAAGRVKRPNTRGPDTEEFTRLLSLNRGGVIIQPFIREIDDGEYALVYIDGQYSHTALRYPAVFRAEKRDCPVEPPDDVRSLADRVIRLFGDKAAFARVDLVRTAAGPVLMELEQAEPYLFFRTIEDPAERPEALNRFAKAIIKKYAARAAGQGG